MFAIGFHTYSIRTECGVSALSSLLGFISALLQVLKLTFPMELPMESFLFDDLKRMSSVSHFDDFVRMSSV